jgi:hypothetical protein
MRKDVLVVARQLIERALQIRVGYYGNEHPLVARCLQDLAIICDNCGDSERAIQLCSRALEIREKVKFHGNFIFNRFSDFGTESSACCDYIREFGIYL